MENFNAYSQYYDLLYQDKDYAAESKYILGLLEKYTASSYKSLLELGCGSGNHARYFCQHGLQVTGIDQSEAMVNLANSKAIDGFSPLVGEITTFRLNQQYDVVVALFHVISYLIDNEALISCFRNTYNHLKKGGLFVFDVWFTPAVLSQVPETRIRRMANEHISVTRLAEPSLRHASNIVDVEYEVWVKDNQKGATTIILETHSMRHFGIPEIELLAQHTGFEVLGAEAFLSGAQPSIDTWGVCFTLRKPNHA
jgi:SAM-dependent methyltransferase